MATTSKGDATELAPIVFTARGLKPDVNLKVFKREFHVHSTVLKLHSAFFQKFLDPPNKPRPSAGTSVGGFSYHWVTKIEEDGTWVLDASANTEVPVGNIDAFIGNQNEEETAFEKLLLAFYNRAFQITNLDELACMTELADYYCSLPALSSALCAAIHRSRGLSEDIFRAPLELLSISKKLRSDVLFKEALILSLGPFRKPKYLMLTDVGLRAIAEKEYNAPSSKVLKAQGLLMTSSRSYTKFSQLCESQLSFTATQPCWPAYFRNLEANPAVFTETSMELGKAIKNDLGALMKSQLHFNQSGAQSGKGQFKEYFLCSEIGDEVLPWDPEEVDW